MKKYYILIMIVGFMLSSCNSITNPSDISSKEDSFLDTNCSSNTPEVAFIMTIDSFFSFMFDEPTEVVEQKLSELESSSQNIASLQELYNKLNELFGIPISVTKNLLTQGQDFYELLSNINPDPDTEDFRNNPFIQTYVSLAEGNCLLLGYHPSTTFLQNNDHLSLRGCSLWDTVSTVVGATAEFLGGCATGGAVGGAVGLYFAGERIVNYSIQCG